MSQREHLQFVTGRLAAPALERVVQRLADLYHFDYTIDVLPITVAALMTPNWIVRHIQVVPEATCVMLPGYCHDTDGLIARKVGRQVTIGPRDLQALPEFFGPQTAHEQEYGDYSIEILAEINHAPNYSVTEVVKEAARLREDGADIIDLGCNPGQTWHEIGDCVQALVDDGFRVSVDSFNTREISLAVKSGAELVLSVNRSNRDAARDWGCEVVAIPDEPSTLAGLDATIETLDRHDVPFRIDPILEPIGFGFAASLIRYANVRTAFPTAKMMMGIGNLTELTEVDSAGLNFSLLAFCEELRIGSVLTTQVINWASRSVKECDLARRLVHFAVAQRRLPKHVDSSLTMLREGRLYPVDDTTLDQLSADVKDYNYRIFAQEGLIHVIGGGQCWSDDNPFRLFQALQRSHPKGLDPAHAFYLGYELSKAITALTIGKQYRQDEALRWGFLTRPERSDHRRADETRPADDKRKEDH